MKARLKTKFGCPYGGMFVLNLPERGLVGRGTSFVQLLSSIKAWRHANAVPIGLGFEDEVEAAVCELYPEECDCRNPVLPNPQQRLSYDAVLAGTRVLRSYKKAGGQPVPQEEANRRAKICSVCPLNRDFVKPCGWICGELKELAEWIIGHRTTPLDSQLKSCQICQCFVGVAVHIPLEFQQPELTPIQVEQFKEASKEWDCWKGEGL